MTWPDLLPPHDRQLRLAEGVIVTSASSVDQLVKVRVPAFDRDQPYGPMPWPYRADDAGLTLFPSEGDRCVVGFAETEHPGTPEPWILNWWPYAVS